MVSITRPAMRASLSCVRLAAMLAIVSSTAVASVQDTLTATRVASSTATSFSGEITYGFDAALNRSTARYKTSLRSGSFVKRVFANSSPVHSLIAAYDFDARQNSASPDAVRLTLISDEYIPDAAAERLSLGPAPLLEIRVGETARRYPLTIAVRTEVLSDEPPHVMQTPNTNSQYQRANVNVPSTQTHIERTASASIPICDFIALVSAREVRGTVAGLDFELGEHVLTGLGQFAAEMTATSRAACGR